jgi:hypothetical protein
VRRTALLLAATLWSGAALLADFSYDQTSTLTGGAMAGVLKTFSKQAGKPVRTSVLVKGDRMVHISPTSAQIIDLGKETITQVDFQKKTYSVMTFAQFSDMVNQMGQAKTEKSDSTTQLSIKPTVKETGQKRTVAGQDARQVILTIEMQGTDTKTGQTSTFMTMTSDMWIAPDIAGYEEVRSFQRRMMQKLTWSPNMGMMTAPGSAKGMSEMMKQMSKLDGVPIYQVVQMGGPAGAQGSGQPADAPPQQTQQQTQPAQTDQPSAGSALGKLAGGRFGGLGGFGRKKKQDDEQPAPAAQTSSSSASNSPGSLMEITSEMSGFSSAPVDASKFEVPAGFTQIESHMMRGNAR